jgi:hypothetical protein
MYDHFNAKYSFKKPPVMVFDTDPTNQSSVLGKTAYYDPQSLEIHIFVDGRHPKDVLRSIAHELIHHRQNMEGRLDVGGYNGPGYYLQNDDLKQVEHEAMLHGNADMREYEDTVKYKEKDKMSLKEWKNNELNKQLLKKFGILKESKKNGEYDDGDGKDEKCDHVDCEDKNTTEEELEEGRNNPRTTNSDRFTSHEDRYHVDRIHEGEEDSEEVVEEGELPDGLKKFMKNNKKGKYDKNNDDDKPPKGAPPAAAETEEPKEKSLQEAIRKIAKAKKVFLNGKRIK